MPLISICYEIGNSRAQPWQGTASSQSINKQPQGYRAHTVAPFKGIVANSVQPGLSEEKVGLHWVPREVTGTPHCGARAQARLSFPSCFLPTHPGEKMMAQLLGNPAGDLAPALAQALGSEPQVGKTLSISFCFAAFQISKNHSKREGGGGCQNSP